MSLYESDGTTWHVVGGTGTSSGGYIRFDTSPQVGDWLEITTTSHGGAHNDGIALYSAAAIEIIQTTTDDTAPFGVYVLSDDPVGGGRSFFDVDVKGVNNSGVIIETYDSGNAGIVLQTTGTTNSGIFLAASGTGNSGISFQVADGGQLSITGIPTTNPGGSGLVWNNLGILSIT